MNAEQLLSANDFNLDRAFVNVLDGQQKQLGYNSHMVSDLASLVRCRMKYLERTKNRSKSHELEFLTQEQYVWDLLDVVSRIQPSDPPAAQCSEIKAFIETLPSSEDTSKAEDMVAEVEEEIRELVKKNRLFANARAPKTTEEFEKLNERLLRSVRRGNHKEAIEISENEDEPWRTMLLTKYLDDINKAKAGGRLDWLPDQRTAWRKTYSAIMSRDGLGQYEAALHGIITGDITHVLPVCRSWEDVIWTFYNARVQEAIEHQIYDDSKNRQQLYLLTDEIVNMARNEDDSERDTGLSFFHNIALAILTGNISRFITSLNIAKSFDPNTREHALRCIAALIVYYNEHMKEPMTKEANDIIRHYAELNGKPNTLRPKILAYYASHLPKTSQIELVSDFLSNYSWDEDEQSILFDMGRQFELDIVSIARRTAAKEINAYLEEEKTSSAQRPRAIRFDDDISERAKRCLRSFKWLLMDEALYFDAVSFANQLIQHALATHRSQLAEAVLAAVPVSVTNLCMLQLGKASRKFPDELCTLEKYRQLLLTK
ncbi:107-domain-containing protein [Zychaea mexicana]|uniref:107-domain-containing protein n=1 Tax=Zychaea mexicana TaxID=64656 RepID=UPI0022FE70BC|nr:107-domain-containing protein [Zychaea mexicana]KAI9490343.1 107-domain-containing protein [Zychaea mexicana]